MILKFDHIAYSCRKDEVRAVLRHFKECKGYKGYNEKFVEKGVENLSIKKGLMSNEFPDHDILLFERQGEFPGLPGLPGLSGLPIEITAYDFVETRNAQYEISDQKIIVNTTDSKESGRFYRGIGFREIDANSYSIKPLIDTMPIQIELCPRAQPSSKPPGIQGKGYTMQYNTLDTRGFCCIAFITNNAQKERDNIVKKNVFVTDIMNLKLHGRDMQIFFAYDCVGDICEIIALPKRVLGD